MADVFISYSRRDQAFVRRLHEALVAAGRETWVDWEGIPPSAKWMDEVRGAIDAADAFVFVVSPDSASTSTAAAPGSSRSRRTPRRSCHTGRSAGRRSSGRPARRSTSRSSIPPGRH